MCQSESSKPSALADSKDTIRQCLEEIKLWMLGCYKIAKFHEPNLCLNEADGAASVRKNTDSKKMQDLDNDASISFGDTVIVQTMFSNFQAVYKIIF